MTVPPQWRLTRALLLTLLLSLFAADVAAAQGIFGRARRAAERAAEREANRRAERAAENAVRALFDAGEDAIECLFTDPDCIESASESGEDVVLVNEDGTYVDRDGNPVNEDNAEDAVIRGSGAAPGVSGANANYDFEPGERVLFEEDFARDNVGDFPRRLAFREGSMEIVQHQGGRALRVKTEGAFDIPLPEVLPETFTMEFDTQIGEDYNDFRIYLVDAQGNEAGGNTILVDPYTGTGIDRYSRSYDDAPSSLQVDRRIQAQMLPIRVMADGSYVKVFVGQERVANVPNADLGRSDKIRFHFTDVRQEPVHLANFRIAAGGRDLYSTLEAEGRVVTEGIYFDTGSATLKPESFSVIQEIATMMQEHPELRVRVEGHTDNEGDPASNLTLSQQRAAAVATMLTGLGVTADRLESAGLGETQPIASNDTAEGRAQNRRVELVRLGGGAGSGSLGDGGN